jgi:hypothetical protein
MLIREPWASAPPGALADVKLAALTIPPGEITGWAKRSAGASRRMKLPRIRWPDCP